MFAPDVMMPIAMARLLRDGSAPALWAANLVVDAFENNVEVPA